MPSSNQQQQQQQQQQLQQQQQQQPQAQNQRSLKQKSASSNQHYQNSHSNIHNISSSPHLDQAEDDLEDDEEDEEDDEDEDEDEDEDDIYIDHNHQRFHQDAYDDDNHQINQAAHDDDADRASDSSFSDSVSISSTPSIPCSDDIDFTLVYALHTFLATVEGQASVVKGDRLTLLDDSNSYWWLIRVLKTQAVGYIPAENIETPYERLARLNKHRNVDLSSATPVDVEAGAASSLAQTRFAQRIPSAGDPVRSRSPQDRRKGPCPPPMIGPGYFSPPPVAPAPGTGKSKTVAFTAPTYFENSGNEWSENDEDESGDEQMMSGDDVAEGDWEGEGEFEEGEEGFEDEEEDSEDEDEDEDDQFESSNPNPNPQSQERASTLDPESTAIRTNPNSIDSQQRQLEDQLAQEHKQQQRQYQLQQQIQQHQVASEQSLNLKSSSDSEETSNKAPSGWARLRLAARASADSLRGSSSNSSKDDSRSSLGKGLSPVQRAQLDGPLNHKDSNSQLSALQNSSQASLNVATKNSSSLSVDRMATSSSGLLNPHSLPETKKLTLTPDIARGTNEVGPDTYQSTHSRGLQLTRQRSISSSSSDSHLSPHMKSSAMEPISRSGLEPTSASLDGHSQSNHSAESHSGTLEEAKGPKRVSLKKEEPDSKKKKSGGLLSGFFGRKKDKKAKGDASDEGRASSLEQEPRRSSSPMSPSELSGRSSSSPPQTEGNSSTGAAFNRRQTAETDMFSTDATLRKQQEEAQEVMHRQYGLSREIADLNNKLANPSHQKSSKYPSINSSVPPASLNSTSLFSPVSPNSTSGRIYSPPGRMRPGSLIGSPAIAGLEVPMLNVLRIFAGENVDCDATFKTVLLSAQTTTHELIMQSVQRFHLPASEEDTASYYLTIKDVISGEETKVNGQQTPLKLFEFMNESLGHDSLSLPSVKRSSVGSISSISSNLSLNPAISRLGMSDFSDDSAVKFYINRYIHHHTSDGQQVRARNNHGDDTPILSPSTTRKHERNGPLAPIQEDGTPSSTPLHQVDRSKTSTPALANGHSSPSSLTPRDSKGPMNGIVSSGSSESTTSADQQALGSPTLSSSTITTSPSLRFAMRIRIYSHDLPEGLVLDPQSNAIIPKSVLAERGQRATSLSNSNSTSSNGSGLSSNFREKVIIFPRNIHVSEAIEHTLEAFGIADGVVDGGDDVEDKISKRRSSTKIRYGLSMKAPDSQTEVPVNLISKVLDAYTIPPLFRPADRTSKEARRRSLEYHPFVLGTLQDLQPSDPIFSLRRAGPHHPSRRDLVNRNLNNHGLAQANVDESSILQAKKNSTSNHLHQPSRSFQPTHSRPSLSNSSSLNNSSILTPDSTGLMDDHQFVDPSSSSIPTGVLSTHRNMAQGIDINLQNHGTIRSRLQDGNGGQQGQSYRYSYIEPTGEEFDISKLIESEMMGRTPPLGISQQIFQSTSSNSGSRRESSDGHTLRSSRALSATTEDDYASAPESPQSSLGRGFDDGSKRSLYQEAQRDDETAIEALRSTNLTIDDRHQPSSSTLVQPFTPSYHSDSDQDLLMSMLKLGGNQWQPISNVPSESSPSSSSSSSSSSTPAHNLDERIQRVLNQLKKQRSSTNHHRSIDQDSTVISQSNASPSSSSSLPSTTTTTTTTFQHPRLNSTNVGFTSTLPVTAVVGANGSGDRFKPHSSSIDETRGIHRNSEHNSSQQGSNSLKRNVMNDQLRDSMDSSRSGSTNEDDDGSVSPVTPLTATSPTGESSNYTPISSATRGIGIDSRQSMNRDLVGGTQFENGSMGSIGIGNGHGLMNNGSTRALLLPLLFPNSNLSSSLPNEIGGINGDPFGLEILMNLIDHTASLGNSEDDLLGTATISNQTRKNNGRNQIRGALEFQNHTHHHQDEWGDEDWIRDLLNEQDDNHSSSSLVINKLLGASHKFNPTSSSTMMMSGSTSSSTSSSSNSHHHPHGKNEQQYQPQNLQKDEMLSNVTKTISSQNSNPSIVPTPIVPLSTVDENNHHLDPQDLNQTAIFGGFQQLSISFDSIDKKLDRLLFHSLQLANNPSSSNSNSQSHPNSSSDSSL